MSDNNTTVYGITLGEVIAALMSWFHWHSLAWAFVNGLFGWLYIVYSILRYGVN